MEKIKCPNCGRYLVRIGGILQCLSCGHKLKGNNSTKEIREANDVALAAARDNIAADLDGSRTYALSRGITEEAITKWEIGYLPWGHGFKLTFGRDKDGTPRRDAWWRRLVFPVKTPGGRYIAGFVGRIIDRVERPKYINTAAEEESGYAKSQYLYGYHLLPKEIDELCIVEGPLDTISMDGAGYTVVGTLGCQISAYQMGLILKKKPLTVCIAYDSDVAGRNAKRKAIQALREVGYGIDKIFIITTPEAKDVDEALQHKSALIKTTAEEWLQENGEAMEEIVRRGEDEQ